MRETRFFSTAFAAALASLLGLGPSGAADLNSRPQSFQAEPASGVRLPIWLVRFKLRQRGFQDITEVSEDDDGFAVRAYDRWGRLTKLFVDPHTAEVIPRAGYGLAHLRRDELAGHLEALGFEPLAPATRRDGHYRVIAHDKSGSRRIVNIDPLSGTVWFAAGERSTA